MLAPFVLDGPINRDAFETYVERVLVPELRKGAIVVMDNLSRHKGMTTRQRIETVGASLLYLPPYSPDFIPIENAFGQARGALAQGCRANRQRPLGGDRSSPRPLHPRRLPKLLRRHRIRCNMIGYCV
jgi:DDE superfamily endonuclease